MSNISYTSDIIKEAAKSLGKEERVVEEVYKGMMSYLKHLVVKTPSTCIFIPHIGKLHVKLHELRELIEFRSKPSFRTVNGDNLLILKEKEQNILNFHNEKSKQKKEEGKFFRNLHLHKRRIRSGFFTSGKGLKRLSELQNKIANEEKR